MRTKQFSLQLFSTSAIALVIALGASHPARAEAGGDVRKTDRNIEKALDNRDLSPIRPIRKVGPDGWPTPTASEQQSADQKKTETGKDANKPAETTGQAPAQDNKDSKQAAEPPKPDASKQAQPAKPADAKPAPAAASNNPAPQQPGQQQAAQPKPDPKAEANKAEASKPDPSKQAAQPEPAKQQAQETKPETKQDAKQEGKQEPKAGDTAANNNQDSAASIRLGTDANGKVAVNDDQERQITRVMRSVRTVEDPGIAIKVGAVVPGSVRLGAVSSDLVEILPQFRGYSFFAAREGIVIVEPASMKIVALVPVQVGVASRRPAPGPATATTGTTGSTATNPRSATRSTTTVTRQGTGAAPDPRDMHDIEAAVERDIEKHGGRTVRSETTGSGTVYRTETVDPGESTVIIERPRRPRVRFPFW